MDGSLCFFSLWPHCKNLYHCPLSEGFRLSHNDKCCIVVHTRKFPPYLSMGIRDLALGDRTTSERKGKTNESEKHMARDSECKRCVRVEDVRAGAWKRRGKK